MTETKILPEEIRELEEAAQKAVDAAAAAREDESTTEGERHRLDTEAARALDEAEAARARERRAAEVDHAVRERQEDRERERKAAAAEETRRAHEKRFHELTRERIKLEERAEKEAAKLRSTLEAILALDKEHLREYSLAGGKVPFGGTPFRAHLANWFRAVFSKPFNTGPVPYGGTDPHNGAGLVERDGWAKESQASRAKSA